MTAGGRVDRRDAGDRRADGVMDGEGRTLRFIYVGCQTYSISRYERCYRSCDFSTYALVNDGESGENCCTVYWWHSKISVPVPWLFIIILNTQIIWIQKHDTLPIKSFGSVKLLLKVEHFSASRNKKLLSCFSKNILKKNLPDPNQNQFWSNLISLEAAVPTTCYFNLENKKNSLKTAMFYSGTCWTSPAQLLFWHKVHFTNKWNRRHVPQGNSRHSYCSARVSVNNITDSSPQSNSYSNELLI